MSDTRGVNNNNHVSTQYSETMQEKVSQTEQEGKFEGRNIKIVDSEKNDNFLTKFFNNIGNFFKSLFGFNKEPTVLTQTKIDSPVVSSTKWTPAEKKFTRLSDPPSTNGVVIGNKSTIKDEPVSIISQPSESHEYQNNAHLDSKSEVNHLQVEEPLQEAIPDESLQITKDQSDILAKNEEKASYLEVKESQKQSDEFAEINQPEVSHVISDKPQTSSTQHKPDTSLEPLFPEQTPAAQPPLVEKEPQLNQKTQETHTDALPTVKNAPLPAVDSSKISTDEKITQNKPVRANAVADRVKNLQQGYLAKEKADDKDKVMKANDQIRNPVLRENLLRPSSPAISSSSSLKPLITLKVEANIKSDETTTGKNTSGIQSVTNTKTVTPVKSDLSINNRIWSATSSITKSAAGVNGVMFFSDAKGNRLVIKAEAKETQAQTLATRFLQAQGFSSPSIILVPTSSQEGQVISTVANNNKLYKTTRGMGASRIKAHYENIKKYPTYMIMPFVQGKPVSEISPQNTSDFALIKQDQFSKDLGKIYIYDRLIGNNDRFGLKNANELSAINAGNLMIDKEKGTLIPIDQSCSISGSSLDNDYKQDLINAAREIFTNGQSNVAQRLKLKFEESINEIEGSSQSFLKTDLIIEGMREALEEIAAKADTILNETVSMSREIIREMGDNQIPPSELKFKESINNNIKAIEEKAKIVAQILKETV